LRHTTGRLWFLLLQSDERETEKRDAALKHNPLGAWLFLSQVVV
jgi:hypothetical protein